MGEHTPLAVLPMMCKVLLQAGIKAMRDKDSSIEGMRTQNHAAVI